MRIVWPNQAEAEHNSLVQEGTQKHMYHPLIRQVCPVFKRMSRVSGRVIFWVLCAMGIAVLTSFLIAPQFILPAEDAVILFQFSRNLATTGAITFIKHGPHAEGATDFGWMVMIAGALKLGIQSVWFVGIANAISSVGLAALLLRIAGCRPRAVQVLFITGVLLATPQYFSAIVGFSTIPFGFLLTLAAFAYLRRKDTLLPLSSLALCLFRPDGVVFAIPMMVAAVAVYPGRVRRFTLYLLYFVLPGVIYFLWRWHYFGQFLPLPFLVKSNAQRVFHLFVLSSVQASAPYLFFGLPLLIIALRGRLRAEGNRPLVVCLIALPTMFYFAMRLDQNIGDRFFFYLPVSTAILIAANWHALRSRSWSCTGLGWAAAARWFLAILAPYRFQFWIIRRYRLDNRAAIARDFGKLPQGTMVVTEAGILPYYSHWKAYDAWGLNTADFAKRLLQPSDVSRLHPDLMLVYTGGHADCFEKQDWRTPYTVRTWQHLTRNLVAGANADHLQLWLVPFGSLSFRKHHGIGLHYGDQDCWFLQPKSPLYPAMRAILTNHAGIDAQDYLALHPEAAH
jgi:hypothetical protein